MEAVGAAASILAIAGAGIQISTKLITFADQVGTASKTIQAVGTDVSVTAGTLLQLGELMEKPPKKNSSRMFWDDQVQNIVSISTRCNEIFDRLKHILGKASQQLRDVYESNPKDSDVSPKIKLSKTERMRWPFLKLSTDPLLSELRDAKGTLMVILQVVHLRHAQVTASLDREEQNDLVRMIAAMRRQQLASLYVEDDGLKSLDAGGIENYDSDSEDSPKSYTILEAWSVTPNTFSHDTFHQFSITQVPVPQQQIAKVPPQDVDEVASMVDSLSPPEKEAIGGVLGGGSISGFGSCSIRSITAQSWTGAHQLFGRVSGRKFNLMIERRVDSSKSSRTRMRYEPHPEVYDRTRIRTNSSDSYPPMYDRFSHGMPVPDPYYARGSSPPPPLREHERMRRNSTDGDWERRQASVEKKRLEERILRMEKKEKKTSFGSEQRTKPQAVQVSSDDELVKSLLTQYTNFDPGEPLVQGFATPPPTYDDSFELPRREPRPY